MGPFPPLLWEPSPSSHAPTPRQPPVPEGDDLRVTASQVSAPLLHPVVGDGCLELSFAEANRKEDNGMNFRAIQKHLLGKAKGPEMGHKNRQGCGHRAAAAWFGQGWL